MSQSLLNNRYQILSSLARGGFGETFLAIDTHLPSGRKCVIKRLKSPVEADELPTWLKERFEKEAIILEELGNSCPQIPKLYAYFAEGENLYLVQEWIEGMTLTQKWKQEGNFSEEEVEDLLIDILPILEHIHNLRIIHRDIKPDNIIIRKSDGKPILIDFGIMKEKVGTQLRSSKSSSVILGTPGYMSPEQGTGRAVYSSDLYSLGLTAVFLLSGKNAEDLPIDHQTGEILWKQTLKNSHSQLISVLERVIRFHPRDRFSTAQEMLSALQKAPTLSRTKVIIPTERHSRKSLPTEKNSGPGLGSWLLMFLIPVAAFGLGFLIVRLHTSFSNTQPVVFPSPTDSPSASPSLESSPVFTPPPKKTRPVPRVSTTPSPSPTPEVTPSETPTPLESPSPSQTPTPSPTPEVTPSETPIPSSIPIPIETPNPSATVTQPEPSNSPNEP